MAKKIFTALCALSLITALGFALVQGALFNAQVSGELKKALQSVRITLVNRSGTVLFDNYGSDLENHRERPEIMEAFEQGIASGERFSKTFGKNAYYFAVNTENMVVRLSLSADSLNAWIYTFISITVVSFCAAAILSLFVAQKLTKNLIEPVNALDLNNITNLPYNELSPFVHKIENQKAEIRDRVAELQSRNDVINAVTATMQEGLIFSDKNGVIASANRSVLDIFGADAAVGKNILHISRNADFLRKCHEALDGTRGEMILAHGRRMFSAHFSPAGTVTAYTGDARDTESEGKPTGGALILFLDISDKIHAEQLRREFSANVSHELKTPLTTICALSEMISSGLAKTEDAADFAGKINSQAKRLLTLINDIIRLSEFDEAGIEREFTDCDIGEIVRTAAESLETLATEKKVRLSVTTPEIHLNADRRMIDELAYNLIDNAVKYNSEGGSVTIIVTEETTENGLFAVLRVRDTGIGISAEHHSRIFERFYRVDKSRSKKTGGTGLGLSIVKHVAELHGGGVSIESEEGKGTTITCRLKKN